VTSPEDCAVIVTAAGASLRMGSAVKKEYRSLHGVPVLAHALLPFFSLPWISSIVVIVPPGDCAAVRQLLTPHASHAPLDRIQLVEGGATRQESVYLGLLALRPSEPGFVLIHDGARPWVDAALISRVRDMAVAKGACVPVTEPAEAVKQVEAGRAEAGPAAAGRIVAHLPRHAIRMAQTPQGFSFPRILAAHEKARSRGTPCADDGEVYALFEGEVAWVEGSIDNRKITWPSDLA
jgi:2-C-methyl-D-erythritol 4-phosphate cytidylyltransferase